MVRFYFDGGKTPNLTVKFNELLSGRAFVKPPLAFVASDEKVTEGVAGDMYLPIPFAAGCKITLDELPFYYNINYRAYAPGTTVKTFTMADFDAAAARLKQTAAALKDLDVGAISLAEDRIEPQAELAIDLRGPAPLPICWSTSTRTTPRRCSVPPC